MLLRSCQHRFRWPSLLAMLLLLVTPVLSQWHGVAAMPHPPGMQAHCMQAAAPCERPAPHLPSRGHSHDACGYCPLIAGLVPPAGTPALAPRAADAGARTRRVAGIAVRKAPHTGLGSRGPPPLRVA